MEFSDPIGQIKGIGKSRELLLYDAGINTVAALLSYIPSTYEDSTDILSVSEAKQKIREYPQWELGKARFAVKAVLRKVSSFATRRGLFLITATFSNDTRDELIKTIWFNQPYIVQQLVEGATYVLFGKVQLTGNSFTLQSPKFEKIEVEQQLKKLGGILPIYRRVKSITTTYLRKYVIEALENTAIKEFVSSHDLEQYKLLPISQAFLAVHQPKVLKDITEGYRRLAIQELLELRLEYDKKFANTKKAQAKTDLGKSIAKNIGSWMSSLPFELTKGQEGILLGLVEEIAAGKEIDSLLYGDVGSGKTIVSFLLAFAFAKEGYSSILIAPTTILATQHTQNAEKLVKELGLEKVLSVVAVSAKQKKIVKTNAGATLYIGTQAIFHDLAIVEDEKILFVCIDEQHRFGVEQRMLLKKAGRHVLTLSATPIPRTLALSFLQFSQALFLEEKPVGRKEIITKVVPHDKETATYEWIAKRLHFGEQAYLVFPRIESEEDNEKQSLLSMAESLKEQYFQNIPTAMLHGGMKEEEKGKIMADFSAGKIRLLFSTSVIEVGVDVSNATTIAIHGAELFGLAQLHQLRGRVGRSNQQGYCFLLPSQENSSEALARLEYFAGHLSGNDVSEYDLTHRGTGTLAGTAQSGQSELRIASLQNIALVKEAMLLYERLINSKTSIPRYIRVKSQSE